MNLDDAIVPFVETQRHQTTAPAAMMFNAFKRNGLSRAIPARGGDWRWRRPA
jgi:hypothetical protein